MSARAGRSAVEAQRKLEVLKRFLLLTGLVYLGLHLWVTFAAFLQAGWLAALATLVTLGFGDLYWAVMWWSDASVGRSRDAAVAAAALAFLSWGSLPFTTPYLLSLGIDAMRSPEITEAPRAERESPAASHRGATADRQPPGGAS